MASRSGAMDEIGTSRQRRSPELVRRPNAAKRHLQQQQRQQEADFNDRKVIASTYFSIGAFLVLACLTVSLLILPLVLPPLPPPPSLLLWLPVALLILLIVLAFMPTDVKSMASSYL
ncbi:protein AUXIN-REGULATED GENE INVOLVED IN ORGAN SIZE-like [Panicum virgatum]|uniref:ARGOS-like protein n=1 Tax=Panicum virgatum TaxID=38727 RepID=A0A8T0PPK0_PANVG|nr:protein AUXIN-REGULATED GENE INVOLVED IN ORGAN SIZE-like [Panicum virgatum]KAG2561006.1 hypothetical protein PVAP13_8KG133900 [Panicum virgatum]